MAEIIPLFPLKLVVFPTEKLNLHIFEPRYKQLIMDCYQENIRFGIPNVIDDKVADFGTELELLEISKQYDGGEMDIKTRGIRRFKINEFYKTAPNKLYAAGKVTFLKDHHNGDENNYAALLKSIKQLFSILKIDKPLPKEGVPYNTFKLGHYVGFSMDQEYDFLQIDDELSRQRFMMDHLAQMIPMVNEMERLRELAAMNGHFKDIVPPNIK